MKSTDKTAPQADPATITVQKSSELSDELSDKNSDRKASAKSEQGGYEDKTEPTRFGDWEIAGRCIDF